MEIFFKANNDAVKFYDGIFNDILSQKSSKKSSKQ